MSYSHTGGVKLSGLPKGENAIDNVINVLIDDEVSGFQDYKEAGYLELLEISPSSLIFDGEGDFDEMEALKGVVINVIYEVTKLYPECQMKAHFRGTNSSTGEAYIVNAEMKDRHVKRIDIEAGSDDIYCPECGEWLLSLGDLEFGFDYDCDECAYSMSEDEIIEAIDEIEAMEASYNEYDV